MDALIIPVILLIIGAYVLLAWFIASNAGKVATGLKWSDKKLTDRVSTYILSGIALGCAIFIWISLK